MPLVTLDRVSSAYGHLPLLDNANLQVDAGERVCVIGRNGTGKSTLLRIIGGELEPDSGSVWRQPALRIGRLQQDVVLGIPGQCSRWSPTGSAWTATRSGNGDAREARVVATRP